MAVAARPPHPAQQSIALAGSGDSRPRHHHTIVVGIDGSPASLRAFDWAVAEAGGRAAELLAVHVLDAPSVPLDVVAQGVRTPCYSTAALEQAATRHLAGLVTRGREAGVAVTPVVVHDPRPARALARLSRDATLLVLGSRGLGFAAELLIGSVGKQCLRRSTVPVVVLPAEPTTAANPALTSLG